jgi:HEAT repeat protein
MSDWRAERDQALLLLEQKDTAPEVRADAAETLVHLAADHTDRYEELRFAIPQLLEDKQSGVRRAVVTLAALVLPDPEGDEFLAARLRDPSEEVRMEAAGQLADRGKPSLRAALAVALEDAAFMVRFEAARGLGRLGDLAALPALAAVLEELEAPDDLKLDAAEGLCRLGGAEARAKVEAALQRAVSEEAREELALMLEEFGA